MHPIKLAILSFVISGPAIFAAESKNFFESFIEDRTTIGAIAKSSNSLAVEITKFFPNEDRPLRILEVGAGTGVFTRHLAAKLREGDRFDVVELTSDFMQGLYDEFQGNEFVNIFWSDILDFDVQAPYDLIVSGLPFNCFNADLVFKILEKYRRMSKPGTVISFFEYSALPGLRQTFMPSEEYALTRATLDSFIDLYEFEKVRVWLNLPPAVVHHLQIK